MDDAPVRAELAEAPLQAETVPPRAPDRDSSKRPSMGHVFLWLIGVVVVFFVEAAKLTVVTPFGLLNLPVSFVGQYAYVAISRLPFSLLVGTSVAYTALSLFRLVRGRLVVAPRQAGYWVLFQLGAWYLAAALVLPAAFSTYFSNTAIELEPLLEVVKVSGYVVSAVVAGCACMVLDAPRWRMFFGTNALIGALILLVALYGLIPDPLRSSLNERNIGIGLVLIVFAINSLLSVVVALTMFIGVVGDLEMAPSADPLYWIGIASWCAYILLVIGDTAAINFR